MTNENQAQLAENKQSGDSLDTKCERDLTKP
jgi:hypothetical protein